MEYIFFNTTKRLIQDEELFAINAIEFLNIMTENKDNLVGKFECDFCIDFINSFIL